MEEEESENEFRMVLVGMGCALVGVMIGYGAGLHEGYSKGYEYGESQIRMVQPSIQTSQPIMRESTKPSELEK